MLPIATAIAHSGFAPQPDRDVDTTAKTLEVAACNISVIAVKATIAAINFVFIY